MSEIAPALLAENADSYKEQAQKLHAFAKRVHIDITDGEFAPVQTVTASDLWWPGEWVVDIHAMVARPSEHVKALVALKPHMIIFHVEVQEDLLPIMQFVTQNGIKVGVALQRSTVPHSVGSLIEAADHVMIFSGNLGHYGGTASLMQLEKVRLIRAIKAGVEIGWDGGVTVENAFSLVQGGVDVLNVGATIGKSADPTSTYATLVNEINKEGVI
ncbi:MAG: rpe, Ribulose-phosphate 3-epimerase [Candidatus Saccharibacteria bacterium]|nr:rpe, Ribulose-phosphate 3-epimerase [Candidatus Saccharibacteria bacterium]